MPVINTKNKSRYQVIRHVDNGPSSSPGSCSGTGSGPEMLLLIQRYFSFCMIELPSELSYHIV